MIDIDLPLPPVNPTCLPVGPGLPVRGRPLRHGDLQEACGLLPGWLQMDPGLRAALPVLWTRLLGHSGFSGDVIEDVSRPPGRRLVGLGITVALDAAWQARLREAPPPHAGAAWYRDFTDGRTAPLDDRALGRANARGEVGMLVLHYGQEATDPGHARVQQVLMAAMQLFRQAHGGLQLCDVWQEALADGGDYLIGMGFRRRTARGPGQPELHGLNRAEAARCFPGTPVRDVFHFVPPVLGFSGAERRMLRLAVTEMTDEDIADEIGVTGHTLKKLWRSAFERVADLLPELFQPPGSPAAAGTRGPEKRRHLLHYLRQHPEELRPWG
jgi:DNA-binding CsgD family transcriptional regulator